VLETVAGELAREGKEYAEALLHEAAAAACRLEAIATMRMTRMTMRNQRVCTTTGRGSGAFVLGGAGRVDRLEINDA
jgi:hypothetical protein